MPLYEYEPVDPAQCPKGGCRFEVVEPITADALKVCPHCGVPVQRVISAPAIHGAGSSKEMLSNKNLGQKGFTKYVKAGDGVYEKVAGKEGPRTIQRPSGG